MIEKITPLILTYNESPNLRRTLERLAWAKEIVIIDSFSTDETLTIARDFPQARVAQRKFDAHTEQWNFGVDQIGTPWVLALDADYVLPESFVTELKTLSLGEDISAYYAHFRYCVLGHPLRGTLYPPRAVLFDKNRSRYVQDGHTQLLQISGPTSTLRSRIDHDDRKPLDRWLYEQNRYAIIEARHLLENTATQLNLADRLRQKIILAPALVFIYTLLVKQVILDGWPGWYYVIQRTLAEMILSLRLLEARLKSFR